MPRNVAAVGELQRKCRLVLRRLGQRKCVAQKVRLPVVETLRVLNQLNGLILLLGLEEHAAFGCRHGLQGEVGHARPRDHQVAGFLDPDDALGIEDLEENGQIVVAGEGLVG